MLKDNALRDPMERSRDILAGRCMSFLLEKGRRFFSFAASIAITVVVAVVPFSFASEGHGIRSDSGTPGCCCGCPPDGGAERKCCCVPAGDGDPVEATGLSSSACGCSLETSRGTDSAELAGVSVRKSSFPPGECVPVIVESARTSRRILQAQTCEEYFIEPPVPPPKRTLLS